MYIVEPGNVRQCHYHVLTSFFVRICLAVKSNETGQEEPVQLAVCDSQPSWLTDECCLYLFQRSVDERRAYMRQCLSMERPFATPHPSIQTQDQIFKLPSSKPCYSPNLSPLPPATTRSRNLKENRLSIPTR